MVAAVAMSTGDDAARAQVIQGRVVDSVSGLGVNHATVHLLKIDGTEVSSAQADPEGRFLVAAAAAGSYRVRVESSAHRSYLSPILELGVAQPLSQTFTLVPLPTELDAAVVTGRPTDVARRPIEGRRIKEFYQRLNRPDRIGSYVTLEQIEHWNPRDPAQLLQRIPGVTVRPAAGGGAHRYIVYMTRNVSTSPRAQALFCPPLFFIDGVFVGSAETVPVETLLPIGAIEGVEAYRGSSGMPAEFNRSGSQCGVIAFWTR